MNKQEFENSWGGNSPQKHIALLVKVELRCSCNNVFVTSVVTAKSEGSIEELCPICKTIHYYSWMIGTTTCEGEKGNSK